MKRSIGILVLVLTLFLAGCGKDWDLRGEVTQYSRVDGDGEIYSLMVRTESGREREILLREDTWIVSWVDSFSRERFLRDALPGVQVDVQYERNSGCNMAQYVHVTAVPYADVWVLEDGTKIDVLEYSHGRDYRLQDGTVLLYEQNPTGPEDVMAGDLTMDTLPAQVQEKISAWFDSREPYYDIGQLLEMAFTRWYICNQAGSEFEVQGVWEETYPVAETESLICFVTDVNIPLEAYGTWIREGAVFRRDTGEWIPNRELFVCDIGDVAEYMIQMLDLDAQEPILAQDIRKSMKEAYIVLTGEALEVVFPAGALESQENYAMSIDIDDSVRALLQPWAVPKRTEE